MSAIGWLGVLLVFAFILAVAYLPRKAQREESRAAVERIIIRDQMLAEQSRLVAACEWVNQPEGIVRIPVERAMELTVEELINKQRDASEDTP